MWFAPVYNIDAIYESTLDVNRKIPVFVCYRVVPVRKFLYLCLMRSDTEYFYSELYKDVRARSLIVRQ